MDSQTLLIAFFWAVIGGAVGAAIGGKKGRTEAGAVFGFLLGPLGWLIVAVGPDLSPKCVSCGAPRVDGVGTCSRCGKSPWSLTTPETDGL
jgi:hypothetical protein